MRNKVKCKETDPNDKKVYYTGHFTDPYSKQVEMKFPTSVVTRQREPIARGSYSEIKKYAIKRARIREHLCYVYSPLTGQRSRTRR
jgi:hypothetical protein